MRYRLINGTDLNVSEIALGTWVFGGREWGETDDAVSIKVIQAAYDNGINFIDTAPIYGLGRSEEVVGKAIRSIGVKMIVATKCGLDPAGGAIPFIDLSPAFIRKEVESSLRRLGVDVIDLYQCHWPDKKAPIEDTFGEMSKLVREGKIRYVGVSNFGKDLIERALKIMPIVSEQVRYSVVEREIEAEILPFCKEKNISVLSYGSLGGGLMTGKYAERPDFPKNDVRSFFYKYYKEPFFPRAQKILAVLSEVALCRGVRVQGAAIAWVLRKSEIAACIIGARTPEQVCDNIKCVGWDLSCDEIDRIENEYKRIFPRE